MIRVIQVHKSNIKNTFAQSMKKPANFYSETTFIYKTKYLYEKRPERGCEVYYITQLWLTLASLALQCIHYAGHLSLYLWKNSMFSL